MPQMRDLIIFDRDGNQRFISTYFPAPQINVRDRPYFQALEGGTDAPPGAPTSDATPVATPTRIARRIIGNKRFAGAAFAAIEPAYLQDFCWSNRLSDDFESVLINAKGEIVASCRPAISAGNRRYSARKATDGLFAGGCGQDPGRP
jgi:hypothetical protein